MFQHNKLEDFVGWKCMVFGGGWTPLADRNALDRLCSLHSAEWSDEWLLRMRFHHYDVCPTRARRVREWFIHQKTCVHHAWIARCIRLLLSFTHWLVLWPVPLFFVDSLICRVVIRVKRLTTTAAVCVDSVSVVCCFVSTTSDANQFCTFTIILDINTTSHTNIDELINGWTCRNTDLSKLSVSYDKWQYYEVERLLCIVGHP